MKWNKGIISDPIHTLFSKIGLYNQSSVWGIT